MRKMHEAKVETVTGGVYFIVCADEEALAHYADAVKRNVPMLGLNAAASGDVSRRIVAIDRDKDVVELEGREGRVSWKECEYR